MKKTLVALAAMTAMCGASATSLTLYGVVDTGLAYNSIDWDGYKGSKVKAVTASVCNPASVPVPVGV